MVRYEKGLLASIEINKQHYVGSCMIFFFSSLSRLNRFISTPIIFPLASSVFPISHTTLVHEQYPSVKHH